MLRYRALQTLQSIKIIKHLNDAPQKTLQRTVRFKTINRIKPKSSSFIFKISSNLKYLLNKKSNRFMIVCKCVVCCDIIHSRSVSNCILPWPLIHIFLYNSLVDCYITFIFIYFCFENISGYTFIRIRFMATNNRIYNKNIKTILATFCIKASHNIKYNNIQRKFKK